MDQGLALDPNSASRNEQHVAFTLPFGDQAPADFKYGTAHDLLNPEDIASAGLWRAGQ